MHRRRARNQTTTFNQEGNRTYMNTVITATKIETVTIVMDGDTAKALHKVLGSTSGDPNTSLRKNTEALFYSLSEAGINSDTVKIEGYLRLHG
jgi:hypothetical protein